MKAYLIKASAPGPFKEYKKYMGSPPQNIFSLAASTPKSVTIDMCDETAGMKPKMNKDADIVVLMFHTPDAVHGYAMADTFRAKGKTVVLAGLHPSFMPAEAENHADAVMIGETEDIWEDLLKDYSAGTLKKRYQRTEPVDPATLKPFPTDIIKPSIYNGIWTVLVGRGCVHRCEYCVIPPFFKGKYRLRPIENIVAEIKAAPATWFELHADNLTADREYAIELFKALKPLNIKWAGESTIKMADDDELLRLAAESGCQYLLIGIETPSQAALSDSGKGFVSPDEVRARIRRFHAHGIKISSSMMFGFDTHTKDIFKESLDFCRHIEIDEVQSVILSPFAGTPFYKRMKEEGRLLTDDWSKYDCANVVFQPKGMTVDELSNGAGWFWKQTNNKSFAKKVSKIIKPAEHKAAKSEPITSSGHNFSIKWKTLLALALIGTSFALDAYWIWGLLFAYWVIKDIREKQAYLVEPITRAESPILYWVLVTMWGVLALYVLSTAPLVQEYMYNLQPGTTLKGAVLIEPAPPSVRGEVVPPTIEVTQRPKAVPAPKKDRPPKSGTMLVSDRFSGFRMIVPETWTATRMNIPHGRQVDIEAPKGRGTLSWIAFDLGVNMGRNEFIALMEDEVTADIPFVHKGKGNPTSVNLPGSIRKDVSFKEYTGNMGGHALRAIIGYGVKKERGYMVLGIHGVDDHEMRTAIESSLETFSSEAS